MPRRRALHTAKSGTSKTPITYARLSRLFKSSIGRKAIVAVTGIFLFAFVVAHMLGNLQIFLGQDALNDYAKHLHDLPLLLWPARIFLLAMLVVHVAVSIWLALENRAARPVPYAFKDTVEASTASRTMVMTGLIIFAFIVYHLLHFTFGVTNPDFFNLTDAKGRMDVYSMVILSYQNVWIAAVYIVAMLLLCVHLCHGVSGLFQTLGFEDARQNWLTAHAGPIAALVVFAGNTAIPVAVLMGAVKLPGGGV